VSASWPDSMPWDRPAFGIGLRVTALGGSPRLLGPWARAETADLDFGLPGFDLDPAGCHRGRCDESGCLRFASAEVQDPFVEERLASLCFCCGAAFELHAKLE